MQIDVCSSYRVSQQVPDKDFAKKPFKISIQNLLGHSVVLGIISVNFETYLSLESSILWHALYVRLRRDFCVQLWP